MVLIALVSILCLASQLHLAVIVVEFGSPILAHVVHDIEVLTVLAQL